MPRVMVMVTTMALGSVAGAAMKGVGPNLPAWGQAAQLATAEGLAPALAAPAASVLVVGETLTISMVVGSTVAMSVGDTAGDRSANHLIDPTNKRGSKPHGVFEGSSKHGRYSVERQRRSQPMRRRSLIALYRSRTHRPGEWEQIRKQESMSYSTHIARGLGMDMFVHGMN